MVLETVLGGAVAALAVLVVILWVVRTILTDRLREVSSPQPADVVPLEKRRVRQFDHVLTEIGLAFLLAVVGYVTLGVTPT